MKDLRSKANIKSIIAGASKAASGTTTGAIISVEDYESCDICAIIDNTVGEHEVKLYEGDDPALSDGAEVAAADIIGTKTLSATGNGQKIHIGYVGNKQYVRADLVSTGATVTAKIAALAYLAYPKHQPTV